MPNINKCPRCGAGFSPDSPGGHCLACLLQLGMTSESGAASLQPGDRIGNYLLLEKIGEGGCGVVFLAEQEEPVRRQVALKVIKPGMDTHEIIARFEAERQLLALLEHPNIAKVFDAGETESGRPFFVMELVRGVKITDYCDEQKLSMRERLELFIPVCQAIQHAHQKGIIHRDLKPSNILVTPGVEGAAAVPRVIDFGIAKLTGPLASSQTPQMLFQQFMGTPEYMSPEQAGLNGMDVDTRSDIYSLGVLLYELLTGMAPLDAAEMRRFALDQFLRFIRETEPPRPSSRLDDLTPPELTTVASCRQVEPASLPRLLRGDLDWIVMKCLEKNRERRYVSAIELALDLRRHLVNKPVAARPPSSFYLLQKFIRRHRFGLAASGAVAIALAVGLCASAYWFVREREATRREAEAEARAASNIGAVFWRDGQYATAEARYREALEIRRTLAQGADPAVALALNNLAAVLLREGKVSEAEPLNREALAMDRKVLGNNSPDVAIDLANLAGVLAAEKKFAEAEASDREALAIERKIPANAHPKVVLRLEDLAKDLAAEGRINEAETALREANAVRRSELTR